MCLIIYKLYKRKIIFKNLDKKNKRKNKIIIIKKNYFLNLLSKKFPSKHTLFILFSSNLSSL